MKCPNCNRLIHAQAQTCKHCGTRVVRKSDKMVRKMTMNARIAMACGGLLIIIGGIVGFYGAYTTAAITAGVGTLLILIGKSMG